MPEEYSFDFCKGELNISYQQFLKLDTLDGNKNKLLSSNIFDAAKNFRNNISYCNNVGCSTNRKIINILNNGTETHWNELNDNIEITDEAANFRSHKDGIPGVSETELQKYNEKLATELVKYYSKNRKTEGFKLPPIKKGVTPQNLKLEYLYTDSSNDTIKQDGNTTVTEKNPDELSFSYTVQVGKHRYTISIDIKIPNSLAPKNDNEDIKPGISGYNGRIYPLHSACENLEITPEQVNELCKLGEKTDYLTKKLYEKAMRVKKNPETYRVWDANTVEARILSILEENTMKYITPKAGEAVATGETSIEKDKIDDATSEKLKLIGEAAIDYYLKNGSIDKFSYTNLSGTDYFQITDLMARFKYDNISSDVENKTGTTNATGIMLEISVTNVKTGETGYQKIERQISSQDV